MHQRSHYVVWSVDTVPNYPQRNTKDQKNTVKLYSPKCKKKKDALGTFRLSTGSCDRAWEIPFLDPCRPVRPHQWFHPLCMTCHMSSCVWCISALWSQRRTSESSRFSIDKLIWNNTNVSQMYVCLINLVCILWMWRARKQNIKFTQLFHSSHAVCLTSHCFCIEHYKQILHVYGLAPHAVYTFTIAYLFFVI